MWIGLNGVEKKDTGELEWKWETEKPGELFDEPTSYANWGDKNTDGVDLTDKTKRCVAMTKDGKWINAVCDMPMQEGVDMGYICEMRKVRKDNPRWTTPSPRVGGQDGEDGGMSGGAVAGVVIGVLLAVVLVGVLMFVVITGRTRSIVNLLPSRQGSGGNRPLY